jgi:hypothetical protein
MQKIIIGIAPNMTIEVSDESMQKVVKQAAFWGDLPSECPICKSGIRFFHRTPQDNEYYGLTCFGTPSHESNFGQYKKTELGFYYKGDWQEAFGRGQGDEPREQAQDYAAARQTAPAPANTGNPMSTTLGDMITSRQLGMIRAIAREANIDPDSECKGLMNCFCADLSKRGASDFIAHLQALQRIPPEARQSPAPVPMNRATEQTAPVTTTQTLAPAAPSIAAPAPAAPVTTNPRHPIGCTCPSCDDIPF